MRSLTSALAALLIGTAAAVVLASGPAGASACAGGVGVTVVVGDDVTCDPEGGESAADSLKNTGHTVTYVDSQPGFICQIDGVPATSCARTPPADRYWGVFWSDGTSGSWKYSSVGASGLVVPDGGWVAFVFQQTSAKTLPSVQPLAGNGSAGPTAEPVESSRSSTDADADADAGALGVVAGGVGVVLVAGIGVAMWKRKKAGGSS